MNRLKKFIAVIVLIFSLLVPLCPQPCAAKNSSHTRQAKHAKNTKSKKASSQKKSKSSHKGKKSRHGKKRRRGRATHISSHETAEQKRQIAAITKQLEENPDLSGDIPELDANSLVWPVKYGYIARGVRGGHSGIDIMSYAGEPVYAVADGVVEFISIGSKTYSGYGKFAIIRHEDKNLWSLYSHCSAIYLYEGQQVKRGQKIAAVGRTGLTTSNHLHFELRGEGRKLLNPVIYLPREGALGTKFIPH